MSDPGPAQLELIRRYARTLREMDADAVRFRGPRAAAKAARGRSPSVPIREAAQAMTARAAGKAPDVAGPGRAPTLPAA